MTKRVRKKDAFAHDLIPVRDQPDIECNICGGEPRVAFKFWRSRQWGYMICESCLSQLSGDTLPPLDWYGRQPEEPTHAMPGTARKVMVMAARAERMESLFSDDDATMD